MKGVRDCGDWWCEQRSERTNTKFGLVRASGRRLATWLEAASATVLGAWLLSLTHGFLPSTDGAYSRVLRRAGSMWSRGLSETANALSRFKRLSACFVFSMKPGLSEATA